MANLCKPRKTELYSCVFVAEGNKIQLLSGQQAFTSSCWMSLRHLEMQEKSITGF